MITKIGRPTKKGWIIALYTKFKTNYGNLDCYLYLKKKIIVQNLNTYASYINSNIQINTQICVDKIQGNCWSKICRLL